MGKQRISFQGGGWYHNAGDSFETDIVFFAKTPPYVGDEQTWSGPHRTWGIARNDAIEYHKADLETARYAIRLLREKRRKENP